MKLSLGMIFKDEIDQFRRIVSTYLHIFDEVVVAVDKDINLFQEYAKEVLVGHEGKTIKVLPYTWINDFSDKRNFVHKNITGDYYMRLDADDAIDRSCEDRIRDIAQKAYDNGVSIVYGYYNYSRDEWGNVNAAHWRETIIKKTDNLFWNKKIHENILPKAKANYKIDICDGLIINHITDEAHIHHSLLRNIKYLLEEYAQDKEKTDSRTLAYLGRMLHGIGQHDKAIYFLEKHIQTSGWDEDRYCSWCMLADAYRIKGNNDQAIAAAFEALSERPDYPDAYLKLHDVYFAMEQWEKAEQWGRTGLMKPVPKNFMLIDPSAYGWRPVLSMAFTLFQLNKFDEALKLFNLAKKDVPTLDFIQQNEGMFKTAVEHKKFMENYLHVLNYLRDNKEEDKIEYLLKSAPKAFNENEIIIKLKQHYNKPTEWSDKSVCIFAMNTLSDWSPKSAEGGIGGSEEAVINLSKELAALGLEVTVFNNCGEQAGVYDGVVYRNAIEFNPSDKYNILVSWRCNIFDNNIEARKRIVWFHDIPNIDFSDDSIKKVDHFVVLSKFHASQLPSNVPSEKVFVSTNGINARDFVAIQNVPREKNRCIYASSYNRGLEQLLNMWPDVRKEVPDATLHVYYGWETYDAFTKQGHLKDNGFKQKIEDLMKQPGVFHHGRVGHVELLKEYAKAEVLAYPCSYVGEINCIALTKAIACGCIAVTNDFAVMDERNIYGSVSNAEFKDKLIATLKNKPNRIDTREYINENSWKVVARSWNMNLFSFKKPVVLSERLDWIRANVDKSSRIIDIGCNKGHLFDGWDRSNIHSVDIDKYDLPNFIQADASKSLPYNDKEFDIAVLGEIVEHTDDPIAVMREAIRVAKKLIITVPWEHKWTSDLKPFLGADKIDERVKQANLSSRLELAKSENPKAVAFDEKDGFEHLFHKHFYTPELLKEHLNKADIVDYKMYELRNGNWSWLGVICG